MMTKEEHMAWWRKDAGRSWETAEYLMNGGQRVFALFAFHLAIEKILKAIWVKDNVANTPPFTHNLTKLYDETDLRLPNGWYDYLATISEWNIEGRYPDYRDKVYERADQEYLQWHHEKLSELKALLESAL